MELPADYRYFMLSISDGGAGPNYGIKPMSQILRGCDLGRPFDIYNCCGPNARTGVLWLTDNGCATSTDLIVKGVGSVGLTCEIDCEEIGLGSDWLFDTGT